MKRSSSPENDDGPAPKRLPDRIKQKLDAVKQYFDAVHTHGNVMWSGTVESYDSQKTVFDCSIKAFPWDEGIKSLFPLKQLTIRILPSSAWISLRPYMIQSRGLILCTDDNTDMMSYSTFFQAIKLDEYKLMKGYTVLKYTASALHLLCVSSISSEHEDYIEGFIETYHLNDKVLGILRSHRLLPCANLEHVQNKLVKQNAVLKEELQNKDKMLIEQQKLNQEQLKMHKKKITEKEEELVRLNQEVDEQKKMAEKKQEELATNQNERDMMKKAINEKDAEIIVKDITMMETEEALKRKDREILSLQQKNLELHSEKEKVKEQLHRVLLKDQCLDAEREIFQETNQSNIEEDTDKILTMETSRLELQNEVTMKQAALDEIDRMMENDFKCSICSLLFIKTTTLNCSHSFCAFCIQKWLSENGTCPHCRTRVTASVPSVVLDNLIETIVDKLGDEAKERRKVTVREREHDISMQEGGHLCSIPEDVETDDETSTVSSPCSSLSHLSPSASLMSPYSCPPSSASTWSRSPASIANVFSPPSVLSTNSPSPACNGSNN